MGLEKFKKILAEKKLEKKTALSNIKNNKAEIIRLNKELNTTDECVLLIQKALSDTQQELEFQISNLVTTALGSVMDNPYEFEMKFETRRNNSECDLWFIKKGHRIKPIRSSGGGAVDIAALALRAAYWALSGNRNTIILDEPFKFLSKKYLPDALEMLRMLHKKLGIQFIMVTHIEELMELADRVFLVEQKGDVSKVKQLN